MQEVKSEIEIAAPIEKVWNIITDINQWAEWSPIINQASGNTAMGETLNITMCGDKDKESQNYSPVIIELDKPRCFHWQAKMVAGFIFTNDKIFNLEETTTGTRLIHRELFDGIFASVFCRNIEESVLPMLNSMNEALKNLAEENEGTKTQQETPVSESNLEQASGETVVEKEETPVA